MADGTGRKKDGTACSGETMIFRVSYRALENDREPYREKNQQKNVGCPSPWDERNSLYLPGGKEIGMTKEEMIAVGDGFNDLSMIQYAGLG